jgi:hypothetical protein
VSAFRRLLYKVFGRHRCKVFGHRWNRYGLWGAADYCTRCGVEWDGEFRV